MSTSIEYIQRRLAEFVERCSIQHINFLFSLRFTLLNGFKGLSFAALFVLEGAILALLSMTTWTYGLTGSQFVFSDSIYDSRPVNSDLIHRLFWVNAPCSIANPTSENEQDDDEEVEVRFDLTNQVLQEERVLQVEETNTNESNFSVDDADNLPEEDPIEKPHRMLSRSSNFFKQFKRNTTHDN